MSREKIITNPKRPTARMILSAVGEAVARKRHREGLTLKETAEKFGKADKNSAVDYIAGKVDMGVVGLVIGAHEDDEFINDVFRDLLNRKLVPVDAEPTDHQRTALEVSNFLTALLNALAKDDDGDGDPMDRDDVLLLDEVLSRLEPKIANIRARAARIRKGGR